ncbi:MAG: TonB-dependent receptor [Gammaproteobacteria bacterium]|nr:TonB-dependent receptor [Gammaproteobacteria bacterium]
MVFAQEGAGALEEIVVTATRRAQNLQQVPVSIVALTGDNLELQGLDTLEDVGNYIPNINIQGGAFTTGTQFRVRGLPNVGVYIDGVWQVSTAGFLTQEFVDIDRVEVLRGPQGTTYGRDAVGGAIRIWTTQPSEEFGGNVTATVGTYDRRDIKGSIDVPITDNLLTKWTASSVYRDGYIESLSNGLNYGGMDQEVFRGDMLWTPGDRVRMRLTHTSDENLITEPKVQDAVFPTYAIPGPDGIQGTADDVQNWGVLMRDFYGLAIETNPDAYPGALAFTPENMVSGYPGGSVGKWQTRSDTRQPSRIARETTNLDVTVDMTDNISVQFLTSYIDVENDSILDWDGTAYEVVADLTRQRLDVFSEEIQISGGGDRISWVAGLYYWDQDSVTRADRRTLAEFFTYPGQNQSEPRWDVQDVFASALCQQLGPRLDPDTMEPLSAPYPPGAIPPATNPTGATDCQSAFFLAGGPFAYDNLTYDGQEGYAVFGEATIGLTDQLDLTLGVRYHDQENEAGPMAFIPGVTAPQTPFSDVLHTGGDPFAGVRVVDPDAPPNEFDETTYKMALQYQFNDDLMGYISYSEGFDSGGIDSVQSGSGQIWFPYDPQIIENTEIGIRSDLAGGRLRLNATYFDSDWNNIQNNGVVYDDQGNELPTLAVTNVGTANASGLELEVTYLPTDNLTLNLNVGLLDTGYTYIAPGTPQLDTSTEFQQAPDTQWNVGVQYVADFSNGGSLTSRIDYAYSDQFWRSLPFLRLDWYGAKNNGPVPAGYDESGDWGVVNARFTYEPADGQYALSLFGTNLTDEYMLNSGFFHGIWGYDFSSVSRPREVGVSLNFQF